MIVQYAKYIFYMSRRRNWLARVVLNIYITLHYVK